MGQISAKPVVPVPPKEVQKGSNSSSNQVQEMKQAAQPKQDDHYENLDQIAEEQEQAMSPNPSATECSSQDKLDSKPPLFKLPTDTKTKADPFSARYDTLRMMPDVQWDKPLSNQQQIHSPGEKKTSPPPEIKK